MEFLEFSAITGEVFAENRLERFLTPALVESLFALTERMLAVNESMNLTAIKDPADVILLHYADSLTVAPFIEGGARVADVGCGAGFPSLPLALARPDLSILAMDSTEKRVRYVENTAERLGARNLKTLTARAEEAGKGALRESFDVVTARAVAALPLLTELCLPLVKVGGKFLAMKGKRGEEETKAAENAIERLGGEIVALHDVALTFGERREERAIVEIRKVRPTPAEFPRAWGKILKKPL